MITFCSIKLLLLMNDYYINTHELSIKKRINIKNVKCEEEVLGNFR